MPPMAMPSPLVLRWALLPPRESLLASSSRHRVMRYFCVSVAEASATVLRRVANLTCGVVVGETGERTDRPKDFYQQKTKRSWRREDVGGGGGGVTVFG